MLFRLHLLCHRTRLEHLIIIYIYVVEKSCVSYKNAYFVVVLFAKYFFDEKKNGFCVSEESAMNEIHGTSLMGSPITEYLS